MGDPTHRPYENADVDRFRTESGPSSTAGRGPVLADAMKDGMFMVHVENRK